MPLIAWPTQACVTGVPILWWAQAGVSVAAGELAAGVAAVSGRRSLAAGEQVAAGVDVQCGRTASGPHIMASLRNLVITILRLAGATGIAAALRYHARRASRPLQAMMKC